MAQAIWTGVVSFGLLQVPVQLMPAERRHDLNFRLLDSRDETPIRYERVNGETGEEVPWKNVVKAYEYKKGNFIVLDQDELDGAAAEATQSVDIEAFVRMGDIASTYFEKPYFLVPVKKGEKGYVLLRETLRDSGFAGLAKVVIRTRQHLAILLPMGSALILNLIRFEQELISAEEYALPDRSLKDYRVSSRELQMAKQLIESMAVEWKPGDYVDETRERLRKLIDSQSRKRGRKSETKESVTSTSPTKVMDFMAVLKKSLDSNRRTPAASGRPAARKPRRASPSRRAS